MIDLEALNVKFSYPLIVGGLCAAAIGMVWLLVRCFRRGQPFFRRVAPPLILVLLGIAVAAAPSIIGRLVPIDLGPRDKIIDGERHLTLTGWDRQDYSFLPQKADAVLLQMANADVTDDTIHLLENFKKLKTLDVSDSQITDHGLEHISELPALETLYLNNTKVSAAAVEQHLTKHQTLKMIWLRGTSVTKDTAETVKAGKPGRRVVVD